MNTEIMKAINKANKKDSTIAKVRKWWCKNDYKVYRVIFFPVWFGTLAKEKIDKELNARQQWSEERANEILNYYVPRRSDWDEETKTLYFFDNGYGWCFGSAKKYLKRKDRRFWKCHGSFGGGKIRDYLMNEFELEGFTKTFGDCSYGWTDITFELIEKN